MSEKPKHGVTPVSNSIPWYICMFPSGKLIMKLDRLRDLPKNYYIEFSDIKSKIALVRDLNQNQNTEVKHK